MNKVIAKNIMGFMQRVQLQGVEVPAYHEAMCALHEISTKNNGELSLDDSDVKSTPSSEEQKDS